MRLLRLATAGLFVGLAALALAACSSGEGPGWTYAPALSPAPVASGSAGASGSPAASGTPGPSTPAGPTVTVVATSALRFDTPALEVAADTPFTLVFDNQDATQPHNVVINNPDGTKVEMGDTSFFTGPEKRTYQLPALAAGEYPFMCQVHPTAMTGVLTVR